MANARRILHELTIDPFEFDKVNESKDHSYRAQSGSASVRVPEGYTGDYSAEILEGTKELENLV